MPSRVVDQDSAYLDYVLPNRMKLRASICVPRLYLDAQSLPATSWVNYRHTSQNAKVPGTKREQRRVPIVYEQKC